MVGERSSSYLHSVPCSLLNERSLGQSSSMTRRGGGRGKVGWLVHRLFAPKRLSRVREIRRRIIVWIQSVSEADHWVQPALGMSLSHKKERKESEQRKSVKDKYNSNCFPSTILKYWKVICIQKRKKRDCKGSISPIIKFIEWTLLQASVRRLRHFYSSKRKGKKDKKRKKKKGLLRDIFVWCWLHILLYFKKKRKKKRKENCFVNLIIICLVVAY